MAKTIKFLQTHQVMFVAGLGSLGDKLPPTGKTLSDLKMVKVSDGVDCSAKGVSFWIPSPNIVMAVYGADEESEKKAAPKDKA